MLITTRMAMADLSIISGVLFLIIRSTLCSNKYWAEMKTFRNHLPTSSLNAITTRSLLKCAAYSQDFNGCFAFAYNTATKICTPLTDLIQRQYVESTYVWYEYIRHCDIGWTPSEESCYLFVDTAKSWQDASEHCASLSSHLAAIETGTEDSFIRNTLFTAFGYSSGYNYWLDGIAKATNVHWKWASSDTPIGYTNWHPGEPSSALEECLALAGFMGFVWNDVQCSVKYRFICEHQRVSP